MSRKTAAALRLEVESVLAGRVATPFQYRDQQIMETAPTGVAAVDALSEGLPRGALTEIFGAAGSGKTSLLTAALATRTRVAEACALVDGRDAFDPASAEAAGVELQHLLWVRCRVIEQALRTTDLLIQGGGFGLIAVDLSDFAPRLVRHVPLNVWFRWRRAVENTRTILVVLAQESNAKTCASLVLRMNGQAACWSETAGDSCQTEARLFEGLRNGVERVRTRKKEGLLMRRIDAEEDGSHFETAVVGRYGDTVWQATRQQKPKKA